VTSSPSPSFDGEDKISSSVGDVGGRSWGFSNKCGHQVWASLVIFIATAWAPRVIHPFKAVESFTGGRKRILGEISLLDTPATSRNPGILQG
jgi:hypothetical protein